MNLPWHYYASIWSWLRHGLIIYWRCADCGKRHLSTLKGWSKHIGYNVPLCRACEDEIDRQYNEHEARRMLEDQARDLCRQYEDAWSFRDWQTVDLISEQLSHHIDLHEAFQRVCGEGDDEEDEWVLD